jgi:hypothetical protein
MTITSLGALSKLSKLKIKNILIVLWDRVVFRISTPTVCTQTSAMENHTMYIKKIVERINCLNLKFSLH